MVKLKDLIRIVLATIVFTLATAVHAEKIEHLPPDDSADVELLKGRYANNVKVDANGNIIEIAVPGIDLQDDMRLSQALSQLRHVQKVGTICESDHLLNVIRSWHSLEEASLADDVSDKGLELLEGMQRLTYLSANSQWVTDLGVKSIAKLKNLKALSLKRAGITDACLEDIATMPNLKSLDIEECAITDRGLHFLKDMKLEFLGLMSTKITDQGIDEIKGMMTLKRIEVVNTKVTNAALAKLKGIPKLMVWGLPRKEVREERDDPKDVAAIEALGISVAKSNVTDNVYAIYASSDNQKPGDWMKHFKGLRNLVDLQLPDYETEDGDLAYLAGMQSIVVLEANSGNFTDAGMKHIGTLAGLRKLRIRDCSHVTADGLKHLGHLANLEVLDLHMTPVTDEGLRHLSKLTKLKRLTLSRTQVTDAGLAHLAAMADLEVVDLDRTQITDAGLECLRKVKKLRAVSCQETGVTREGLIRLKKDIRALALSPNPDTDNR